MRARLQRVEGFLLGSIHPVLLNILDLLTTHCACGGMKGVARIIIKLAGMFATTEMRLTHL